MAPLLSPWLLVYLGLADVYFTGSEANVIVEARAESICTYQVNQEAPFLNESGCVLDDQDFVVAVATDADEDLLFFSDILSGKLFHFRDGQDPAELLYGLGSVEGIAVDWLARNLYWTDFALDHICVSRYDGKNRSIIVGEDVLNPRGIAVEPFDGLIFWADLRGLSDSEGRIERSNMDGTGRVVIVDEDLASPSGLVIDLRERRLYFADRGTDKIESVTYDGQDRDVLYQRNGADFLDLTVHRGILYATIWRSTEADGTVMAIDYKGNKKGDILQTLEHEGQALGITTMDRVDQPVRLDGATGACGDLNGGCDHLCLPVGATRRACACATGYSLADDEVTCETHYVTEHFLLVADSSLNAIYQVDPTSISHNVSALPLDELDFPVSLAYDHVDSMVYWTDRVRSAIGRTSLDGTRKESVLFGNIAEPGGLALDTRRRLVYWTDEGRNEISVAGMDGDLASRVFIDEELDEPRAITVNLLNGDVYWTDWGKVAKIERVSRDGNNRVTLVEGDLAWLNCLAIDPHDDVMYWCDAQYDRIEMSDLNGDDRRTLVSFDGQAHPFSLAIYGEFIYWTDWLRHRLSRANRWSGDGAEELGENEFLRMQGLVSFEVAEIFEEDPPETTISDYGSEFTEDESPYPATTTAPPPMTSALNITLIIAAAGGGGLVFLLSMIVVCWVVKCARSKGSRGPDDHVPMSVRSTSFVGSYDPPGPGHANNNPPPLPPARKQSDRKQSDHIYQDIDEYQKAIGGEAAYQAYLNPTFKGEGDQDPQRYEIPVQSPPKKWTPAPPHKPGSKPRAGPKEAPPKQGGKKASARPPDDTYLTPNAQQDDYMALKIP